MFLAGVDEAGRGPVLGPLVLAGVVMEKDAIEVLVEKGLTDSKLLKREFREELYQDILEKVLDYKIVKITAQEIDFQRMNAINLNKIELNSIVDILNSLKQWEKAFVDACDTNAERFELTLQNLVNTNIKAEHFADKKYPIVSAASVIAKVTRDNEILKAQKEYGVDFGSGYPNDPKTIKFLKNYYEEKSELPSIARRSWDTVRKIIEEQEQSSLDSFFVK
ncbi:MAG: ribonuclease HII [Candidatus Heimdallarchaeota archaeon]|nr:ribonuclease HII [Candidatus Heimdallarchaeota archaeon]